MLLNSIESEHWNKLLFLFCDLKAKDGLGSPPRLLIFCAYIRTVFLAFMKFSDKASKRNICFEDDKEIKTNYLRNIFAVT